jgi:hypothetical protein
MRASYQLPDDQRLNFSVDKDRRHRRRPGFATPVACSVRPPKALAPRRNQGGEEVWPVYPSVCLAPSTQPWTER